MSYIKHTGKALNLIRGLPRITLGILAVKLIFMWLKLIYRLFTATDLVNESIALKILTSRNFESVQLKDQALNAKLLKELLFTFLIFLM